MPMRKQKVDRTADLREVVGGLLRPEMLFPLGLIRRRVPNTDAQLFVLMGIASVSFVLADTCVPILGFVALYFAALAAFVALKGDRP